MSAKLSWGWIALGLALVVYPFVFTGAFFRDVGVMFVCGRGALMSLRGPFAGLRRSLARSANPLICFVVGHGLVLPTHRPLKSR